MNKSDLIDVVSKTTSLAKREADEAVNALIHVVTSEVKAGRRVVVAGFGSFNPTRREARMGRNPQTGAPVAVPAVRGVRFAPSVMFKDILNGRAPLPVRKATTSSAKVATGSGSTRTVSGSARAAKKTAKRAPARKAAKRTTAAAAQKIVRRAPAKKVAKRVRANKAAKQSARKAVRRAPARKSSRRVPAKKAVKRSARRP